MMEDNKNKNKKRDILNSIIEIVLIIIIILLLLHNCGLQRKNSEYKNKKIPTGNVDVIEIKCDSTDRCKKVPKNKGENTVPVINPTDDNTEEEPEEEEVEELVGFIVDDDYAITWNGSKNLKIFANPAYEFREVIAPESSNTYKFVVKNTTAMKLKYKISFTEKNPYNINLKYKLKKEDTYLVDKYVSYNKINTDYQEIDGNSEHTYYLDWKWVSSSNDTEVGKIQANYKLNIEVKAESINE